MLGAQGTGSDCGEFDWETENPMNCIKFKREFEWLQVAMPPVAFQFGCPSTSSSMI